MKGTKRVRATETIISRDGILELDKNSKAFLILQEIRDESHRFAIKALRRKNRKKITYSELDNIKGIGKVLKNRLLKNFKSISKVKKASFEQLMKVRGINAKIAMNIITGLNE